MAAYANGVTDKELETFMCKVLAHASGSPGRTPGLDPACLLALRAAYASTIADKALEMFMCKMLAHAIGGPVRTPFFLGIRFCA